jgi:hypothetical protein
MWLKTSCAGGPGYIIFSCSGSSSAMALRE